MADITEKDIVSYFMDTVGNKKKAEVEKWLIRHFENERFEEIAKEFWTLDPAGEGMRSEKEMALKHLYRKLQSRRKRFLVRISTSVAVSLLIIITTAVIVQSVLSSRVLEWQELYTEYAVRDSITLPDGTAVWLNSGSRIIYPSTFSGNKREVFISGEAYFDVAKYKNKCFAVHAGPVTVTVLGTEFNMRTSDDMSKVDVELYEGSIMISAGHTGNICLSPGEKAVYDSNTGKFVKYRLAAAYKTTWMNGSYESGYKSLSEIASDFEKLYGVKVIIADEILASKKYQISLVPGMKLDDVLETLNYDSSMTIHKYDKLIILNTK